MTSAIPVSVSLSAAAAVTRKRRLLDRGEQQRERAHDPPPHAAANGLSLLGLLERRTALLADRSSDVWRVFARQEEALQALHSSPSSSPFPSPSLRLFSHELSDCSGAREFIVSSYSAFYRRYMALPARHRHHYEVILHQQRQQPTTYQHQHQQHADRRQHDEHDWQCDER